MSDNIKVSLFDLAMSMSDAMDLVTPKVVDHHKLVAYIAAELGEEYGMSNNEIKDLIITGLLHDSGALSLQERLDTLRFEGEVPHRHSEKGYRLLRDFQPLAKVARIIRYHHVPWQNAEQISAQLEEKIPVESHVIHLADRVSVLLDRDKQYIDSQERKKIKQKILQQKGKTFAPELVEAFESLADKEYFWLDLTYPALGERLLSKKIAGSMTVLSMDESKTFSMAMQRLIDFRSSFTATHSSGVSTTALELAKLTGFSKLECDMMEIAGHFHDLGKLAVPNEILNKPGKLTDEEFSIIRYHTYYTYRSLERIPQLETINLWAALHHERLDGQGYPFQYSNSDLPLGSKVMAVADVFTALTEDRPYREGMPKEKVSNILKEMSETNKLDSALVELLLSNYEHINNSRDQAQTQAGQVFENFNHVDNQSVEQFA